MSSAAASPPPDASPIEDLPADERIRYEELLEDLEQLILPDKLQKFEDLVDKMDSGQELVDAMDLIDELVEVLDRARLDVDESELLEDPARYQRSAFPTGKIPGFGEPEDDCGEETWAAMFGCPRCGNLVQFEHNCYRYDCPIHGLHGVRRRAAGSASMPGLSAKLGALRAMLGLYFHHAFVTFPKDFFLKSDQPLERGFQLCREVMDCFDAQGLVAYHPWRGEEEDDRNFWKTVLGHDLEWDDVREQLIYGPHFHLPVAAPKGAIPGGAVTLAVEAFTGVVIGRITPDDSDVSVYDDEAMARLITYSLSHSMIYTADDDSRRLAARLKGPDVNDAEVYENYRKEHWKYVFDAAEKVLGIKSTDLKCRDKRSKLSTGSTSSSSSSTSSSSGSSGASRSTDLPNTSNVDATGEVIVRSSGPAEQDTGPPSTSETSTSSGRCGGRLRHISTFDLEELAELDAQIGVDASDLEVAYRSYIQIMEARGRKPDDRPEIPEFEDRPPPD